jgi:hypothetical protein
MFQPSLANLSNVLYHYLMAPPHVRFAYMFQYQRLGNFYAPPPARTPKRQRISDIHNSIEDIEQNEFVLFMELHTKNANHDKDNCEKCRQAMAYLLTPPDLKEIYPEAYEFTVGEYSLFGQNLKLFDNPEIQKLIEISNVGFNFASIKRFSTGLRDNSFDESCVIGGITFNGTANDAASGCDTTSEFDEIWIDQELSINSPFKPSVNSTMKKQLENSVNSTPWKQPVVLDPSLSPPYNDAFPSLDSKNKQINQEKRIVRAGNGVSKKTRK